MEPGPTSRSLAMAQATWSLQQPWLRQHGTLVAQRVQGTEVHL